MTTTVHLPPDLLERLDERARELGMSRNRYIVRALEKAIEGETEWSPRFLEALEEARKDSEACRAVDEMMRAIRSRRSSKKPRDL